MLYTVPGVPRFGTRKTGEPLGSSPGNILANQIRTLVPAVSQISSAEGTYSIAVSNSFARFLDRTYSAEITHLSYCRMTTSRIYAYRWPARLVSHKPFAAERYFITSSCIWQVFFREIANFLFYSVCFISPDIFCAECTMLWQFFLWKTPLSLRMPVPAQIYTRQSRKSSLPRSAEQKCFRVWLPQRSFQQREKNAFFYIIGNRPLWSCGACPTGDAYGSGRPPEAGRRAVSRRAAQSQTCLR